MLHKSSITGQAKSIHHMITQLVKPSSEPTSRQPSLLVHPATSDISARRGSQTSDSEFSTSHRRSSEHHPARRSSEKHPTRRSSEHHPGRSGRRSSEFHPTRGSSPVSEQTHSSSAGDAADSRSHKRALSAHYSNRRHTVSSVPETKYRSKSSPPRKKFTGDRN